MENVALQGPPSILTIGGAEENAEGILNARRRGKRPKGVREHAPPESFKINASRTAKNTS